MNFNSWLHLFINYLPPFYSWMPEFSFPVCSLELSWGPPPRFDSGRETWNSQNSFLLSLALKGLILNSLSLFISNRLKYLNWILPKSRIAIQCGDARKQHCNARFRRIFSLIVIGIGGFLWKYWWWRITTFSESPCNLQGWETIQGHLK